MDNDVLKRLLVNEKDLLSESDVRHIENYKNLAIFLENELAEAVNSPDSMTQRLFSACFKCIRHLDQVVFSYDNQGNIVKEKNRLIEALISHNNEVDNKKKEQGKDLSELVRESE